MAQITIFGRAGTGTSSTGKALAKELGYEFLSTGSMFREKARSLGMDFYDFEQHCNTDKEFNDKYNRELDLGIATLGKEKDNFIIDSWLAWHFIPHSFKVKLVCDFDERIRRVAARDKVSVEYAKEKTQFRENSLIKRYSALYNISDYAPDSAFDLILDTTTTPLHKVVAEILKTLRSKEGLI